MYRYDKFCIGVMKVRYLADSRKHSLVILGESSAFSLIGKENISGVCWQWLLSMEMAGMPSLHLCHGASHSHKI